MNKLKIIIKIFISHTNLYIHTLEKPITLYLIIAYYQCKRNWHTHTHSIYSAKNATLKKKVFTSKIDYSKWKY